MMAMLRTSSRGLALPLEAALSGGAVRRERTRQCAPLARAQRRAPGSKVRSESRRAAGRHSHVARARRHGKRGGAARAADSLFSQPGAPEVMGKAAGMPRRAPVSRRAGHARSAMTARTVTWRARDATPRPERAAAATKAQRAFRQAGAGACAAAGADRAARRAAAAGRQVAAELASALIVEGREKADRASDFMFSSCSLCRCFRTRVAAANAHRNTAGLVLAGRHGGLRAPGLRRLAVRLPSLRHRLRFGEELHSFSAVEVQVSGEGGAPAGE